MVLLPNSIHATFVERFMFPNWEKNLLNQLEWFLKSFLVYAGLYLAHLWWLWQTNLNQTVTCSATFHALTTDKRWRETSCWGKSAWSYSSVTAENKRMLSSVWFVLKLAILCISLCWMGFYLPPMTAGPRRLSIVPFLADLFLELIEGVQRSSALECKSLCLDGVGRSVTLHNRKHSS